jgi:hypothetical protein
MSLEKSTKKSYTRLRKGRKVSFTDNGVTRISEVYTSTTQRGITMYGMKVVGTSQVEIVSHNALTERINKGTANFDNSVKKTNLVN